MSDFLTFRLMITPVVIQVVFWLGVLLCFVAGIRILTDAWGAFEVAKGAAVLVVGPLLIRILCELDIILFKIHDELKETNDRARYKP